MKQPMFTIYLLHFDRPMGRIKHYLGITRAASLGRRAHDHQGTNASQVTARAARAGIGFTLAKTIPAESHSDERRLKKAGHFDKWCPICRGDLDLDHSRIHYAPRPLYGPDGPQPVLASFPSKTKKEHPRKKRGRRVPGDLPP